MSAPTIAITLQPTVNRAARYLRTAPPMPGQAERAIINPRLVLANQGTGVVTLTKVVLTALHPLTNVARTYETFLDSQGSFSRETVAVMASGSFTWVPESDLVCPLLPTALRVQVHAQGFSDPATVELPLAAHTAPTADGSYRFWAEVADLRPEEVWQVDGTGHAQTNPAQLYAYDVGVESVTDGSGGSLAGSDGTQNEHRRIWGKPIYAVADGTVLHFRNDFPTNPRPLAEGEDYAVVFPDLWALIGQVGDGNGNFFTIRSGVESVLYAHMQPGSLNPALLTQGAAVKRGDFLGLAGNSGASSGPHLHIHANAVTGTASDLTPPSWTGAPRPMPLQHASCVDLNALRTTIAGGLALGQANWVGLNGRGLPPGNLAVWPSDAVPFARRSIDTLTTAAVSSTGRLWIATADLSIKTTGQLLPAHGVVFDRTPGGSARRLAIHGEHPYVIGSDSRIWEGLPTGWVPLANSPTCVDIAVMNNGTLYVVTNEFRVRRWDPGAQAWSEPIGAGPATGVAAATTVYLLGIDNRVRAWNQAAAGWTIVADAPPAKAIAADPVTDALWIIRPDGHIVRLDARNTWREYPGGGVALDILAWQGTPYVLGTDHTLWRGVGRNGWYRMNLVEPA